MDLAPRPTNEHTFAVVQRLAALVGAERGFRLGRRWYIPLGEGRQISIRGESGERFRLESWHMAERRATVWALAGDEERLAGLFLDLVGDGAVKTA